MKLIVLTEDEANKLRGQYKPNHICEPVWVNGFHILHEGIKEVPEILTKILFYKMSFKKGFVIGDNSPDDVIYKDWISRTTSIIPQQI